MLLCLLMPCRCTRQPRRLRQRWPPSSQSKSHSLFTNLDLAILRCTAQSLQVHQAAAQAEAALAAFQSGVPMPNIGAAEALLPGSAGANMAAAGNAAAANHNEAAVAAGMVPAAALVAGVGPFPGPPGAVPASGPGSNAAAAMLVTEAGASSVPTPYVVVVGMITPDVLEDGEEYEEVRRWTWCVLSVTLCFPVGMGQLTSVSKAKRQEVAIWGYGSWRGWWEFGGVKELACKPGSRVVRKVSQGLALVGLQSRAQLPACCCQRPCSAFREHVLQCESVTAGTMLLVLLQPSTPPQLAA
jgi:hypothetical protein